MFSKKLALSSAILALSGTSYADANLAAEIQLLKEKLTQLEQQAQVQQTQITQISESAVPVEKQSAKSNIEIKPYGFVRLDAGYHFEGSDKMFNRINNVPLDNSLESVGGRLFFTPTVTRLGIDVAAQHAEKDIQAKIEVDFRGGTSQDQLRIRHAYLKVDNWLFGQTTSPFVSSDILPEMIDFQANLGGAMQRNPMVQYQYSIHPNLKAWVALEDGSNSKNEDDQTRLPALTAKLQFKADDQKSVLNARTLLLQKKTSEDEALAWGIGLGGIYYLDSKNKFHADYYHVKGDSKYVLYSNTGYVLDQQNNIVENEFDSIALGYTHFWNSQWRSTLGFGGMWAQDGQYAEVREKTQNMNESIYQGWSNVVYTPTKSLTYALEYVYGERKNFQGETGTDNRLEAMVRYAF